MEPPAEYIEELSWCCALARVLHRFPSVVDVVCDDALSTTIRKQGSPGETW
jgi:hypothetical protein